MKRTSVPKNKAMPTTDKRPADWTAAEKLTALHETHGLSGCIFSRMAITQ
jgi:hypothetical protein